MSQSRRRGGAQIPLVFAVVLGAVLFGAGLGIGGLLARGDGQTIVEAVPGDDFVAQETAPSVAETADDHGHDHAHDHDHDHSHDDAASEAPQGRLPYAFEPASLDFGIVPPDRELTAPVTIRNVSDEPLKIDAMRSSCKCTTLEDLSGTVLPPGGSKVFTPVIDARNYPGSKETKIRFVFGGHGVVDYVITSNVQRPVITLPPFINAIEHSAGKLQVRSSDGKPFRILGVNGGPAPYGDGFDPASDEPKNAYTLSWDVTSYDATTCTDAEGRRMPRWWVIETDHPGAPILDVRLRHRACTKLEYPSAGRQWMVETARLLLGKVEAGSSQEFEVELAWLRDATPRDDTIRFVESETDQLAARLIEVKRNGKSVTCRIEVTVAPDHSGLVYGEIRLFGDVEGQSQGLTVIGRVPSEGEA